MTHAYNELYLNEAKKNLSQLFEYLINDCKFDANWVSELFISSGFAKQFERGNPAVISGMSGIELAKAIIDKTYQNKKLPFSNYSNNYTPEYWAGWALAEFQWFTGLTFKDIFEKIKLSEIIAMYPLFHEIDISRFIESLNEKLSNRQIESKLKRLRESRGMSQSELAKASGVKLRSIQLYEQRVNDIDKAQAQTLYKLSVVIGCNIEDLLENPMKG